MKLKFKRTDLKDPNKSAFVFHPKEGVLLVDHDQVAFYLEQGWFDKPVTKEMLQKKLDEANKINQKGNKKNNGENDSNYSETEEDESKNQEGKQNEKQKK